MQKLLLISLGLAVLFTIGFSPSVGENGYATKPDIPPGLRKLIPPDAQIERIAHGFQFTEGPVWHKNGYLLFSDIPADIIYKWEPSKGVSIFRKPSGKSNGLTFDHQGRLICCEHGNRRVSRIEKDGKLTILASVHDGKRLNSPNDVVIKSDGGIYFTDPPYGVDASERELEFQGVYRISPSGKLSLLISDFSMPNGLSFSPDEKYLYIADSSELKHIRVFEVKSNGDLANGRIFAELKTNQHGAPDGIKVDTQGNVWVAGPGGIWIFDKTGKHLGTLAIPETPTNCTWGDSDKKTLYITARTSVYRIRTNVAGIMP
jgi:gluconolactonase